MLVVNGHQNLAVELPRRPGHTRIAIVDDSEVYRIFLRKVLLDNADFDVICLASNGRLALPRIRHYNPDVVILDHDMPEMNGLETIRKIREFSRSIRIIMFSAHTSRGAALTLEALEAGAEDFVTKPGMDPDDLQDIRRVLPEKIRALVGQRRVAFDEDRTVGRKTGGAGEYRYCGIGISTGGPTALGRLLPLIAQDIRGSVFIVQHLPPLFTAQLAENLNSLSRLRVVEAADGMVAAPGWVYIAPGGMQMTVEKTEGVAMMRVFKGPAEELCKPSANILFKSLAESFGAETVGVVMTGMGDDGLMGLRALHAKGGYVMAQAREDCLIYGMPAKPVSEGLVSYQGDAENLAARISTLLKA